MEKAASRWERFLAAISYIGPLFLPVLLIGGTRFVRLHMCCGMLLYAASLMLDILFFALPDGMIALWLDRITMYLFALLSVIGSIRAATGKEKFFLKDRFCERIVNFTENL